MECVLAAVRSETERRDGTEFQSSVKTYCRETSVFR